MTGDDLTAEVRSLVRVSAALASGGGEPLEQELLTAANTARYDQVEEALLQSYLFLGYPATLDGLARWRRSSGAPPPPPTPDDWRLWEERGDDVCRRVYSNQYDGLRENVRLLHPDIERWMVAEGYGKVLGRPQMALATRELCIVALLAVVGADRQLYSHLRGALHSGADAKEVEAALTEAAEFMAEGERRIAWETWQQVRRRSVDTESKPGSIADRPRGRASRDASSGAPG